MKFEESGIEGLTADLNRLDDIMENEGFVKLDNGIMNASHMTANSIWSKEDSTFACSDMPSKVTWAPGAR